MPDTKLNGIVEFDTRPADVDAVMLEIEDALEEQEVRLKTMRDTEKSG